MPRSNPVSRQRDQPEVSPHRGPVLPGRKVAVQVGHVAAPVSAHREGHAQATSRNGVRLCEAAVSLP